jgi:hypothetical protein
MDLLSRHPTLTRLTRIAGIALSLVCVVVLAPASFFAWQSVTIRPPAENSVGLALFFSALLVACVVMFWRALFIRAKPHHPRMLKVAWRFLITVGICGVTLALAGLALRFGRTADIAITLASAIGCLSAGISMRRRVDA